VPDRRVCPVVVRHGCVLAFRHPLAGCQLVKGRFEPGEGAVAAARRELWEESGLRLSTRPLRQWRARIGKQVWHFVQFRADRLPNAWAHWADDDGGHLFRFFWQPLRQRPGKDWHPVFCAALKTATLRTIVRRGSLLDIVR
jgi:8-oxo-dGTP pyrophosphatase MutT (NUDIX family)